ncbi:MAG: DUF1365 family protein [Kiritimatiellae bacterium]|nr:DUF1365 family protein [Kiritimatiellia bacterium]
MNTRLIHGHISHIRLEPEKHAFSYPVFFLSVDLDEIDELDRTHRLFRHNRWGLLAIHDRDYLEPDTRSIADKARAKFEAAGLPLPARIQLITCPRFLGYLFNPVSFYYGLDAHGRLLGGLAEVNNTFGERNLYLLRDPQPAPSPYLAHFTAGKNFHVSPFNDLEGTYHFHFGPLQDTVDVRVDLEKKGRDVFKSQWQGKAIPLSDRSIVRTVSRYPLSGLLTMARIHWQAAILYFRKRLPFYTKPVPTSPTLLRKPEPTRLERRVCRLFLDRLSKCHRGSLHLTLPDGGEHRFGNDPSACEAHWQVRDHHFFRRLATAGDIGVGEAFMAGEWTSKDPANVLKFLVLNLDQLEVPGLKAKLMTALVHWFQHRMNANTRYRSRRNIQAHYDLSNDFFKLFLDPSMMYSSAVFADARQSLEQAQQYKIRELIRKARIESHHHVLEIGSGWGSFALEAARLTGCRVTSITLSEEQLALARERARLEGLDDRVTFELRDYRDLQGQYDRVVSIEMIEAVGHAYLGSYFQAIDRALKPNGIVVLQAITIPDQRYEAYRKNPDWIQKYIFPGGHLPSLTSLSIAMTQHSRLGVEALENIGPHYARTLRCWREAFNRKAEQVKALGFDETFIRMWNYYLSYCEAAFATRSLNTLHLVITRPQNQNLDQDIRGICHQPANKIESTEGSLR